MPSWYWTVVIIKVEFWNLMTQIRHLIFTKIHIKFHVIGSHICSSLINKPTRYSVCTIVVFVTMLLLLVSTTTWNISDIYWFKYVMNERKYGSLRWHYWLLSRNIAVSIRRSRLKLLRILRLPNIVYLILINMHGNISHVKDSDVRISNTQSLVSQF